MEHTHEINQEGKKHIVFLILLAIAIGALLFTSIILVRNAEEIKTNPIQYSLDKGIYDSCTCYNELGADFFSSEDTEVIQNRTIRNL